MLDRKKQTMPYLGVLEVIVEGLVLPDNSLVLVGLGVRVTGSQTRLAAEKTVQVGSDLVGTALYTSFQTGDTWMSPSIDLLSSRDPL